MKNVSFLAWCAVAIEYIEKRSCAWLLAGVAVDCVASPNPSGSYLSTFGVMVRARLAHTLSIAFPLDWSTGTPWQRLTYEVLHAKFLHLEIVWVCEFQRPFIFVLEGVEYKRVQLLIFKMVMSKHCMMHSVLCATARCRNISSSCGV